MTNDEIINTMITGFGTPNDIYLAAMNKIYSSIPKDERLSNDLIDLSKELNDICVYSILYDNSEYPISFALMFILYQNEKDRFVNLISFTNPNYRNNGYASQCITECITHIQQLKPEPWIFCVFHESHYKNKHLLENQHGFLEIPFIEQGMIDNERDNHKWYSYYHLKSDNKHLETEDDFYNK